MTDVSHHEGRASANTAPPDAARNCGTCGGPLSGPDAPFPRCVPCGNWEDECSCAEESAYVGTEANIRLIVAAINALAHKHRAADVRRVGGAADAMRGVREGGG